MSSRLVHEAIAENAIRFPDRIAVTLAGDQITYSDLQRKIDAVAQRLVHLGVAPETLIGVPVERTVESLVGMLGVLAAGAGYVPLHGLPTSRFEHIRKRASLDVFVGGASALGKIPLACPAEFVAVDDLEPAPQTPAAATRPRPDNIAYVIFTSGTSGVPKGVVTSHRSLMRSTESRYSVFPSPASGYLMLAPFSFDAASAGIYFTLTSGGRLVVPTEEEVLDPGLLAELIAKESITHLDGVPSQYAVLLQHEPRSLSELQCVIVAGEALHTDLARRHFEVTAAPLFNEYGPTEGTVWSTICRLDTAQDCDSLPALVPLGHAIESAEVRIVAPEPDSGGVGEIGEILIAGAGLARGYLGDPAGTAAKFVPHPSRPGCRAYRTGDLGQLRDGVIHFRGRADRMVKVRGFRVELDEVEASMSLHPAADAVISVSHETADGTRIAAFIVSSDLNLCARDLRSFALSVLPEFMVPQTWRRIASVPLTRHGKADRSSLRRIGPDGGLISGSPIL